MYFDGTIFLYTEGFSFWRLQFLIVKARISEEFFAFPCELFPVLTLLRMVLSDKTMNKASASVHMNNLYRVVQYCENQTECRRAQLLEYFGETGFDSAGCSKNQATICDNCSCAAEMVDMDVTQVAKMIVESVNTLIHRGNSNWKRPMAQLTLKHLVDVFKVRFWHLINNLFGNLSTYMYQSCKWLYCNDGIVMMMVALMVLGITMCLYLCGEGLIPAICSCLIMISPQSHECYRNGFLRVLDFPSQ